MPLFSWDDQDIRKASIKNRRPPTGTRRSFVLEHRCQILVQMSETLLAVYNQSDSDLPVETKNRSLTIRKDMELLAGGTHAKITLRPVIDHAPGSTATYQSKKMNYLLVPGLPGTSFER